MSKDFFEEKIRNILAEEAPISTSEKLVREEIKKLNANSEEIKKLREEIQRHKNNKI